uniref:Uncharacterized protein n=1 Tax=Chromera velia CCMP2878 TaxID=1169474 RepID=A0A0G4F800_9ALVE|eukprot:Cvel_15565.t1-p1 / transcript=Cvel_15565.t1 / gene=Cvel_15565 / organism=Chromera_velia_CCMP2878 / gene_product=hypothetical protein / transcript_product=hypothetical protein / location=Cvel_scaffold1157:27769-28299(-) / protein_length=177 / sequence_SO=supercontig / SO=protein_coding / is_pseudo=false
MLEPVTVSGRLLVNGVLASSFSSQVTDSLPENLHSLGFAHPSSIFSLTWPLRMWHSSFGLSNGNEYGPLGDRFGGLVASWFFDPTRGLFPPTEAKEEQDSLHPIADLARHVLKKIQAGESVYEGLSTLQRLAVFAVAGRSLQSLNAPSECRLAGGLQEEQVVESVSISPQPPIPVSA